MFQAQKLSTVTATVTSSSLNISSMYTVHFKWTVRYRSARGIRRFVGLPNPTCWGRLHHVALDHLVGGCWLGHTIRVLMSTLHSKSLSSDNSTCNGDLEHLYWWCHKFNNITLQKITLFILHFYFTKYFISVVLF